MEPLLTLGVHQTVRIVKIVLKLLAKWHNCTAPQIIVHRTVQHDAMQFAIL